MYDPEFDDLLVKKSAILEPDPAPTPNSKPQSSPFERLLRRIAIPRFAEAVFAEALRHGLVEGIPVDRAVGFAAEVNPCRRFRRALKQMATHIRSGYPIEFSLTKTGVNVRAGLLAALRVGEDHGCLVEELAAFARRTKRFTSTRFTRAIGRSEEAKEFAAALSRLLRDHRLTIREVRAAGDLADNSRGRFSQAIEHVARRIQEGESFAHALGQHPAHFDALYRGLIDSTRSRDELRACLARLGERP